MDITPADLARVRELYHRGQYRHAHDAAAALGDLRAWAGTPARLLGGRLAIQLGAPKLGRRLHLLAYRATPAHPEAVYYHARYRLERFGPLSAWQFLRDNPDWSEASPELQADRLALQGFLAARLRDFDRAERWLNKAETTAPGRPWPCVERAAAYEFADRLDDALASARRSLELHPWFRPGVQSAAHALVRMGKHAEAADLLAEADTHLESGLVVAQLAGLRNDLGRHSEAWASLDRYEELSPRMEKEVRSWLAARRADTAYRLGDTEKAATFAAATGEAFFTKFAGRLESARGRDAETPARVLLPVDLSNGSHRSPPGVHDLLARHWGHPLPTPPADAAATTDGLPDAADRKRAEAAGWAAREFRLTCDAALSLLARGVPVAVSFVEGGFGQARLAVGADRLRHTLFLADGGDRLPAEAPLDAVLERYKAFGPRAVAIVPAAEAARLEGLTLPDADEYEQLYAVQKPLLAHDREAALIALRTMEKVFPTHRLTKFAVVALARYDAHPVKALDALDALLADFPHDPSFVLAKASLLRELNRLPERLALLEAEGSKADADPMLMQSLAQMLLPRPDRQADASRLLRRSLRTRPTAAAAYYLLGTQWWEARRFPEAAELYRFAACLEDGEEQFADAYSRAARAVDQAPEVLRLFQQKAGRAEVPSPTAAKALYNALLDRDEPDQALAAVDAAARKLQETGDRRQETGEDGKQANGPPRGRGALSEVLLFRAECHAANGRWDAADADLEAARPLAPPAGWHRAAAKLARTRPDFAAATLHLLDAVKHDPLNPDGHRALTALLTDTEGRAAARAHLGQACQRFPHFYPLLKLRAEFLSADAEADPVRAIDDALAECPHDAWAWRQKALVLADRKRHPEALAAITRAGELEPDHPWYFAVLAQVHRRADRTDDALAACRSGLQLNVDNDALISDLVQVSRGRQEKADALAFVADELRRQPHAGDGLAAYHAQARQAYTDPDDHGRLLETLEEFLEDRPDLWQAWSAVVQQMAVLGRLDEAHALARDAAERFPLLPKLWVDLAEVCQAAENAEGRLDALRQAVTVAPGWSMAAREFAEALEEAEEPEEAIRVQERAAVRSPMDPFAHGFLAERLWEAGRSREALDRAKAAVRHEPGYDWAWHAVQLWAERMELPDEPLELARTLTKDRAGDPRAWLKLARLLHHPRHNDEALAALDKAVALDPKMVEAHDQRAERLAEMGRFDDARAAAQPPQLVGELPFVLQGRLAWVEAKRGNYAAAIAPMQALVAVDPSYVWGWQQLAEWYNETNKPEGYLEAASELVRLQPYHPVAYMMRGEARLQTGDRDDGKADLRECLKISPGFTHAATILFDAHLADDEIREATQVLAVLQEHAAGPEVAVKQVQLAVRTDDADEAVRAFAEVCEGPGGSPFPIQTSLAEMKEAGWEDRALRVLRDAWQGGGPFQPWVPLFWVDSTDGAEADPDVRLRAVDAGLKAFPRFMPLHDCKAEQLASAGRYDEALAACSPPEMGDPPPVELRGRAAWVEAKRGDRARAISLMKAVVAEDPDFALGWRQLAAWYDALNKPKECLEAAEQFARLEPDNPLAFVYRGDARRSAGDRRGARADFQRAFDADPSFDAAGVNLIAEQLAADDVPGAARTLAALREHADGPVVRLRAVQVACRQGELGDARTHFRGLATDPDVTRATLREAAAAFDGAGWGAELTDDLKDLSGDDGANPDAAGLWAERAIEAGGPDAVTERLPALVGRHPDAGREVVLAYVWALVEADKPAQGTVQRYSEILRAGDPSWARAGAALVAGGNHSLAVAWLADWRDREDVQAWMLRPLTVALRAIDQDDKANDVCRAAVKLGGPDELLAEFRAWLALDLALSGQTEEAAATAARVDGVTVPDGVRLILSLAEAILLVQRAGPGGRSAAFREAKDHLRTAAGSVTAKDVPPGAARAYRKAAARVASDAGTLAARAWAAWQRVAPWVKG